MMKQARVEDIAKFRVTRLHGHIAVITHYYPRFLKKSLIHEYLRVLAPDKALLHEFKAREDACGSHDLAFTDVDYESKFLIDEGGWNELRRLVELSRARDVYLVCHCELNQRCHRELIMLAAREGLGAQTGKLAHAYPTFLARLKDPADALAGARSTASR